MAVTTYFAYTLAFRSGSALFGAENSATVFYLLFAVLVGIFTYAVLVIISRTITKQDLLHIPGGGKIAKLFRIK